MYQRARSSSLKVRFIVAAVIAIGSVLTYYSSRSHNPITDEVQSVALTVRQEVALGLEAAPQMARQHGGLSSDEEARARVERIGRELVDKTDARSTPYQFDFHLLADPQTVNAFALPGGQVFMTEGLYRRLKTDGQVAGVLAHEIGHVVARHGAEHLAKGQLIQGLTGAAAVATYDPDDPASRNSAMVAAAVGQLINLKYGRSDELESDRLGVRFLGDAGYDPRALLAVMEILSQSSGGARGPEFFQTHPNPDNRMEKIQSAIEEKFPSGVPKDLRQ